VSALVAEAKAEEALEAAEVSPGELEEEAAAHREEAAEEDEEAEEAEVTARVVWDAATATAESWRPQSRRPSRISSSFLASVPGLLR
jgi:hypothetical protein